MTHNLAREVRRVLRPDGHVLIYDFRVPSPLNRNTRAVRRSMIRRLFPDLTMIARSLTLLPPLARRLGFAPQTAYSSLAAIPFLRTHNMMLLGAGRN